MNNFFLKFICLFLGGVFSITLLTSYQEPTAKEILNTMLKSISELKTVSYTSILTERIGGRTEVAENNVKMQVSPFKVYIYLTYPRKGAEVLYVTESNNNKALIKPNRFPYINLNIDPHSALIRDGQHHSLFELGYSYFGDIIKKGMQEAGEDFESRIILKGSKKWESYDCYVISMDNPDFKYLTYTVKSRENLITIGNKLKVSEYMIMEANSLTDYNSVTAGQIIRVPNSYAFKTILYIDKKTFLPVVKAMFDEKGLFEKFEYKNLVVNPVFSDKEFTPNFPGYGF